MKRSRSKKTAEASDDGSEVEKDTENEKPEQPVTVAESTEETLVETQLSVDDEERPSWIIWSISSYAFIMLVIGLPLWWKTTEVQRAYLPYDEMLNAKSYMAEQLMLTMDVNLYGFSKDSNATEAVREFNSAHNGFIARAFLKAVPSPAMDALYKNPDLASIDEKMCGHDQREQNNLNIYYLGRADFLKQFGKKIVLGNCRSAYYISNSNKLKPEVLTSLLNKLTPSVYEKERDSSAMDRLQLPLSLGYDFLFTLIVPEPEVQDFEWNMELAREKYLPAVLGKLEQLFAVTVRSQYLYYVRLNVNPRYNKLKDIHEVPHEQLPLVINPVESKLRSFVSQNNVLNFLVYTAPCSQSPLHILAQNGELLGSNSFLVPQWGGIQVYNAACPQNVTGDLPPHQISLSLIYSTVAVQVRELFGISQDEDALPLKGNIVRDWEIDMIARKRLHELLHTTANTLESLSKLLSTIKNIVVTEEVGQEVHKSTKAMRTAVTSATEGKLTAALRHATEAYRSSETAFHHPSNLAQLYFPDDQKYAIYIPLFLPIGIPVLVSLKKIFAHFFPKKMAKTT